MLHFLKKIFKRKRDKENKIMAKSIAESECSAGITFQGIRLSREKIKKPNPRHIVLDDVMLKDEIRIHEIHANPNFSYTTSLAADVRAARIKLADSNKNSAVDN